MQEFHARTQNRGLLYQLSFEITEYDSRLHMLTGLSVVYNRLTRIIICDTNFPRLRTMSFNVTSISSNQRFCFHFCSVLTFDVEIFTSKRVNVTSIWTNERSCFRFCRVRRKAFLCFLTGEFHTKHVLSCIVTFTVVFEYPI